MRLERCLTNTVCADLPSSPSLQVIDSSDSLRMIVIKEELDLLLKHDQLASNPYLPILFCANKMDLKDALSSMKIVEHLGLNQIGERPWHIQVLPY